MKSKPFLFLIVILVLAGLPCANAFFTDNTFINPAKVSTEYFEISFDDTNYQLSFPFEHSMDRIIKIKNIKNEPIDIEVNSSVFVNGQNMELPGWPQPFSKHYEAFEEKEVIFKVEMSSDISSNRIKGQNYDFPFNIKIYLQNQPNASTQFVLMNKILFLETEDNANNLKTNAKISGVVVDEKTNQIISGARVKVWCDGPRVSYETTTDSSGAFSISVPAYQRVFLKNWIQFSVVIEANGYGAYNTVLAPKTGDDLEVDVKLKLGQKRANYQLISKYDTGLPTARVVFSKDGAYFATVPFHSSEKIDFIKERAYLHLFSSDGNLICRYKIDNEIPTVDLSDDASLIATVYRHATDNWGGGDDVLLLDNNCNELWRSNVAKVNDFGPSEVRISHNKKYVAVGTYDGRLLLLDILNKKVLWNVSTNNGQVRYILFNQDDSGVFFGSDPNLFYYQVNGDIGWKVNIGAWPYSMALSKNYIFVGVKAGRFLSLINKSTGEILWRYPIDARPDTMLISPDETYFVYQSSNGGIAIKNAFFNVKGELLFNLQGANAGTITSDSEYLVYYSGDGVHLVNRNGHQLWQQQLGPEKWPAPRGAAYISDDKTKIIVADAVNGNVYFFEGGIENIGNLPNGPNNQNDPMGPVQNISPGSEVLGTNNQSAVPNNSDIWIYPCLIIVLLTALVLSILFIKPRKKKRSK